MRILDQFLRDGDRLFRWRSYFPLLMPANGDCWLAGRFATGGGGFVAAPEGGAAGGAATGIGWAVGVGGGMVAGVPAPGGGVWGIGGSAARSTETLTPGSAAEIVLACGRNAR